MLNTLNQCCQMLWLQQRELASLRSMITTMQEKLQTTSYDHPTNSSLPLYVGANSCLYPVTMAPPPPPPSDSRESSQIRSGLANPKMNQVSSATSLPNLNHPHAAHATNTIESAYVNQNNLHNARILESSLNNTVHQNTAGGHANNTLLSGVNQSLPSQIWNGQALNNQVAPGNRANNYWDNFRSYSRQNLLSTKSNEGIQNQSATGGGYSVERTTNNITDRCQSYTFPSFSTQKRNPNQQESSNSSADNTPKRKTALKTSRHSVNTENIVNVSADVVNVNDVHRKSHDNNDLMEEISVPIGFEPFADAFADHLDTAVVVNNNSNRTADNTHNCKNCSAPSLRNLVTQSKRMA
ncbi:hypothetical protein QE152_g13600 [Popillia japonica]|uniref:Uncharacterized protein n=1 Tax=Popillia japonica TaxID=7064 RepID=A0AAW1L9J9_POPJA